MNAFPDHAELSQMVVCKEGVRLQDGVYQSSLCKLCYSALKSRGRTPVRTLVNDLFIGERPVKLADLTVVEEFEGVCKSRSKAPGTEEGCSSLHPFRATQLDNQVGQGQI